MNHPRIAVWIALAAVLTAAPAFSQNGGGHGQAVVTVLPKAQREAHSAFDIQKMTLKVAGKDATVTKWEWYKSPDNRLELVLLFDDSERTSIGTQQGEIEKFINSLPPGTKAAIAYMQHGSAVFSGPLTADHAAVLRGLRLPSGLPGSSTGAYFCLSDLAKRWPSQDAQARREVVMVTDGASYYQAGFDLNPPDINAAITDSARAGLVVYSIYWTGQGRFGSGFPGQNLLNYVTTATGGNSYWMGTGNPVSFRPYFHDLLRRFQNQYELGFSGSGSAKPEVEALKLKFRLPGSDVSAPEQVLVVPAHFVGL